VLDEKTRPTTTGNDQTKFHDQNREVVMLIRLLVTDEMLPEV
jgi:hypothetical protein